MEDAKIVIARRTARFLKHGDVVNLGIGTPELVANYLPEDVNVIFQAENGIMGMGAVASEPHEEDINVSNAGGKYVTTIPGAMFFDSAHSFGLIRGGHVDATILGALQVDEDGSLASHIIPGKMVPGMGGAMDLVSGAENVIVITTHTDKKGNPKILPKCTLPLTAYKRVKWIISELAVIECTPEGLVLREVNAESSVEEVVAKTGATLIIPEEVGTFV
ncbi:MAG: 3-oxoacid CoA-transferase subunit B [Oscillospiraceae bacterium]|nr:3-oxoacid CoA-transferase subunit B [Oscillospiraceae bacterium]